MAQDRSKKQVFVDIISPGSAIDFAELEAIKGFLKKSGFSGEFYGEKNLILSEKIDHEFSSFAAQDRFLQLKEAIYNDKSDVIWCAKGGYGTIELVEFFAKLKKPKKEKLFIGFSDITILNRLLIDKFGWKVIVAPMLSQIVQKTVTKEATQEIIDVVSGKNNVFEYKLKCLLNEDANISAKIDGGCLSVLAAQFGTKNQINFKNKILFLEDEGESGERIDRYLSQILQIMTQTNQYPKAILLGNFLQENIHGNIKKHNIETAILRFVNRVSSLKKPIPIFQDQHSHFGHSQNMKPLILGQKTQIQTSTLTQTL